MNGQSRTKETIIRIQELRRSGAAKRQERGNRRNKTRQAARDKAIREQ
jgi:hypothetical protein